MSALLELEKAVYACPPGVRRRAAVELVVSRVRRLVQRKRAPARVDKAQVDLEDLLAGRAGRR